MSRYATGDITDGELTHMPRRPFSSRCRSALETNDAVASTFVTLSLLGRPLDCYATLPAAAGSAEPRRRRSGGQANLDPARMPVVVVVGPKKDQEGLAALQLGPVVDPDAGGPGPGSERARAGARGAVTASPPPENPKAPASGDAEDVAQGRRRIPSQGGRRSRENGGAIYAHRFALCLRIAYTRARAVLPADLLPFLVGAAVVADRHLVDPGSRRAATLAVISGSNPKRSSSMRDALDDLAAEGLVAGLHVGEVQVGDHVGERGEPPVAAPSASSRARGAGRADEAACRTPRRRRRSRIGCDQPAVSRAGRIRGRRPGPPPRRRWPPRSSRRSAAPLALVPLLEVELQPVLVPGLGAGSAASPRSASPRSTSAPVGGAVVHQDELLPHVHRHHPSEQLLQRGLLVVKRG